MGICRFLLRDKQALVAPGSQSAMLATTPADPPFKMFRHLEIDAKLSDAGVLEGKMLRSYRGDAEVIVRALFRQLPQSQWNDVAHALAQGMGFAGEVSEVNADSPEDTSHPFQYSNEYTRKDYPDWPNRRILPPLGFVGLPEIKDSDERTQPIVLGGKEEITDIARVELPKGCVPRLPLDVDEVRDFAEYHSIYTFNNGVFTAEVHLLIKRTEIPLSALKEYQSLQEAIADDQSRYTEIRSGAVSLNAPKYLPKASSNPDATKLVDKAREEYKQHDDDAASENVERALKLDASYVDAWTVLGNVRLDQGRFDEGLKALQKAIDLDPNDTRSYIALADAYQDLRKTDEAIKIWREVLKRDPDQRELRLSLATTLLQAKHYSEAVPDLEAYVARYGTDLHLDFSLAEAYINTGNKEKAVAALKHAGQTSTYPEAWYKVAFNLAEYNLSLSDALLYAVKAVHSVEDRAVQTSLAEPEAGDLVCMALLARYWDSLGWVYFQQGQLDRAQRYIEAAWSLDQDKMYGEHLAKTYERQGKNSAADHLRDLAKTCPDLHRAVILSGKPQPVASFSGAEMKAANLELLKMRRTPLSGVTSAPGRAEFFVLIAPGGKVEDSKFIDGDEPMRSLSKALAGLTFNAPLPDDAPVKLVREGVLQCKGSPVTCEFTLTPVTSVR